MEKWGGGVTGVGSGVRRCRKFLFGVGGCGEGMRGEKGVGVRVVGKFLFW